MKQSPDSRSAGLRSQKKQPAGMSLDQFVRKLALAAKRGPQLQFQLKSILLNSLNNHMNQWFNGT
jgi:hypothetical protein